MIAPREMGLYTYAHNFYLAGLRELDKAYTVVMGPMVGSNKRPGPNYTSDAAVFKESDEESAEENGSLSFMVQKETLSDTCWQSESAAEWQP